MLKNCTSCGKQTKEYSAFPCPSCGEETIVRCKHCREIINPYKCKRCGYAGP
ncbi:MAG: zinc finger domain-containing protein [Candidatus Micrarchaeota archaeon]